MSRDSILAEALATMELFKKRDTKGGFSKAPTHELQKPKKKRKKNPSRRIKK